MKIKTLIAIAFLAGCGSPQMMSPSSLSAGVPQVISVIPKEGSVSGPESQVSVILTKEIDPATVGSLTLVVIENFEEASPTSLESDIASGDLKGIDGTYRVTGDGFCVTFKPAGTLVKGKSYGVVVTRKLMTKEKIGLPKTHVSKFTVISADAPADTVSLAEMQEEPAAEEELCEENPDPDEAPSAEEPPVDVLINEVFYDAVDTDTNGDLFIELFGTPMGKIGGYKLLLINGDDGAITATLTLPAGAKIGEDGFYVTADAKTGDAAATNVTGADFVVNFDPQNGPDGVQLLDDHGSLADSVCYGNVALKTALNGLPLCSGGTGPDAGAGMSVARNLEDGKLVVNSVPSPGSQEVTP